MDLIDLKLLKLLEEDARMSFAELADNMQMSKTPVWKRVKALEEAKAISGYQARLDPKALGFGVEAIIEVTLDFAAAEAFEREVARHPSIWRCHATTGDADYSLHVLARNMEEMDHNIRHEIARFSGVIRTRTSIVTRAIKRDQSLSDLAMRR
jgi:Lrp/AsnC family leucine-responsive transcriptional regulator